MKRVEKQKNKGITLIALVITVIILLILAGITVGAITGNNGIIGNAGQAKEETEIANEKEIVEKATVQAMGNNKYGNIEENELQKQLDKETDEGKTEVTDIGNEFEIYFKDTNRYYAVDKNGNILGQLEPVTDPYPGDITRDEEGNTLTGDSKEDAYQINCIEDLVEYSKVMNSINAMSYGNKYVKLCRNLNFKSKLSYADDTTTIYDEFLGGDGNTSLMEQLSENGKGFYPINGGPSKNINIAKEFDGQGYALRNIYINQELDAGLIGKAGSIHIENLEITGKIISKTGNAGGICGMPGRNSEIMNCKNKAIIKSDSSNAGGIIGAGSALVKNSYNYGDIFAEKDAGGISGSGNGFIVQNCVNMGDIISNTGTAGGILGNFNATTGEVSIYNSYNIGEIHAEREAGGIMGYIYASARIENVYNIGEIKSNVNYAGGIIGGGLWNNPDNIINYCYYSDNSQKGIGRTITDTTIKCQDSEMKSGDFLEELNQNIATIGNSGVDVSEWCKWTSGENEYPTFE